MVTHQGQRPAGCDTVEDGATRAGWLAAYLMRERPEWYAYAVAWRDRLRRLSRSKRRWLLRRAAATLTGAALLLALGHVHSAGEATIHVSNGEVAIADNGKCSLMEAIINARASKPGQLHDDCTAGNLNGPDTVRLPVNGEFVLTEAHNSQFGPTGLPVITRDMKIDGHGSVIRRSAGSSQFRIMSVDPDVQLTLIGVKLSGGAADTGACRPFDPDCHGGGILNYGELTVTGSTISGNYSYFGGGGISNAAGGSAAAIFSSTLADNSTSYYGGGGAIDNNGELILSGSRILNNYANSGGCLWNGGEATIERSLMAANGSQYLGTCVANGDYAEMTISNSTITGNAGGDYDNAIHNSGNLKIYGSSIVDNSGYSCGITQQDGELTIGQSLVTGNSYSYLSYSGYCNISSSPLHPVVSAGYNVIGHNSDAHGWEPSGPGDIVPDGPISSLVGPLADNGGTTFTHALPSGSPAIDRAPNAMCLSALGGVDQRGEPRNTDGDGLPSSNECDAGAFELQPVNPTATATATPTATASPTTTPSPTATPSPSATNPSATPSPTVTTTPSPSATPTQPPPFHDVWLPLVLSRNWFR